MVRSSGGSCLREWRSRVQHGKVSELLLAHHLRLYDGEVLRQLHTRRRLFAEGIYQWRRTVPCLGHWNRQCDKYSEHSESGTIDEWTGHNEGVDESLLRHCLRDHPGIDCGSND